MSPITLAHRSLFGILLLLVDFAKGSEAICVAPWDLGTAGKHGKRGYLCPDGEWDHRWRDVQAMSLILRYTKLLHCAVHAAKRAPFRIAAECFAWPMVVIVDVGIVSTAYSARIRTCYRTCYSHGERAM